MKHLARLLSLLILVSAGIFFANCDGGDEPKKTDEEKQLEKLEGDWIVTGVTFDGDDAREADFLGGVLNITTTKEFNFSKTGGVDASPWPANVDWEFGDNVLTDIDRLDLDGTVPLTYVVSGDELTITIDNYTGSGYSIAGKAKSVEGEWIFEFTRD